MAQEESMFGPTPLAIQDQLDQQFLQRNSNLDLGSMSARAGLAIGNGINGLLGREDPRVAEAKQVQEAVAELRKSGVDMSNPEEYYKKMAGIFGAKGLTAQAEKAAMKALEYQDKQAERAFNTEDRQAQLQIRSKDLAIKNAQLAKEMEKAKEKPGFEQLLKTLKDGYSAANVDQESLTKVFKVFAETGSISLALDEVKNKKEKAPEQWGEPVERNVNGKVVLQQQNLGTKEWKTLAGNEANIRNTTNVSVSPDDRQLAFNLDQIGKGKDEVKEMDKQLRALDNAYVLLNSRTPAASSMGIRVLAGAIQSGTLSKGDVAAVDNTGSLFDRLQNYASKGITGTPSESVTKDLQLGIKVLRSKAAQSREETLAPYRRSAAAAKRDPNDFFPEAPKPPGEAATGVSDKTKKLIEELKRNP